MMPPIYVKKVLYDEIIRKGYDVNEFVERTAREELERLKKGEEKNKESTEDVQSI